MPQSAGIAARSSRSGESDPAEPPTPTIRGPVAGARTPVGSAGVGSRSTGFGVRSLFFRGAGFRLLPEAGGARVVRLLLATVTL